jgi:hypothetical protein
MKHLSSSVLFAIALLVSCNGGEPPLPYTYNANPRYTWGYTEYFGKEYADYGIDNNILSVSLFSDSLSIDTTQSLVGTGQYLFLEDVFVRSTDKTLPVGTYTVDTTSLPFTVSPGKNDTVGTEMFPIGATISYYEQNADKSMLKFITSGTFTVSKIGIKYNIVCDFKTSDKKELKGSFTGELKYYDESLNSGIDRNRKKQHKFIGF